MAWACGRYDAHRPRPLTRREKRFRYYCGKNTAMQAGDRAMKTKVTNPRSAAEGRRGFLKGTAISQ
ncbi:MAG: hypothetical protein F4018_02635 [Acidobacteria bacterium]|nr:hypothetical protein [Acidobacteriota bacterium]